jgi:glycosyltransferase involved in cell wall biosynthesis
MVQGKKISLITRFMDRLRTLSQVFPSWLTLPEIDEIIIVNWSSKKDDIAKYLKTFNDKRIILVNVENQKFFNRGMAWNTGIHCASGEWLFCIDGDVSIKSNLLNSISLDENVIYRSQTCVGTCIVEKDSWKKVKGYAEYLQGWGEEDIDYYLKLEKVGVVTRLFNDDLFGYVFHDFDERNQHDKIKDCGDARELNIASLLIVNNDYEYEYLTASMEKNGEKISVSIPVQTLRKQDKLSIEKIYNEQKYNVNAFIDEYKKKMMVRANNGFPFGHREMQLSIEPCKTFNKEDLIPIMTPFTSPIFQKSNHNHVLSFPRPKRI